MTDVAQILNATLQQIPVSALAGYLAEASATVDDLELSDRLYKLSRTPGMAADSLSRSIAMYLSYTPLLEKSNAL